MRLSHIHLTKPILYTQSLKLQEALVEKHFAYKTSLRNDASVTSRPPNPTLLTFQTQPTYTVGRRHLTANPLSESQISFLKGTSSSSSGGRHHGDLATFFPSPRGGLLTYHAPGQLTAYLVLDLRTHGLTPRCYIRTLENTVMRTCARHGVANTTTTDDPGVWITERPNPTSATAPQVEDEKIANDSFNRSRADESCVLGNRNSAVQKELQQPTNRKICAIGVHVSRGITSHGIGLNVFDAPIDTSSPLRAFYTLPTDNIYSSGSANPEDKVMQDSELLAPGYLSWGFSRIVACGLEGKSVTWLAREQSVDHCIAPTLENVAESLAEEVAQSLMIEKRDIDRIIRDDITD